MINHSHGIQTSLLTQQLLCIALGFALGIGMIFIGTVSPAFTLGLPSVPLASAGETFLVVMTAPIYEERVVIDGETIDSPRGSSFNCQSGVKLQGGRYYIVGSQRSCVDLTSQLNEAVQEDREVNLHFQPFYYLDYGSPTEVVHPLGNVWYYDNDASKIRVEYTLGEQEPIIEVITETIVETEVVTEVVDCSTTGCPEGSWCDATEGSEFFGVCLPVEGEETEDPIVIREESILTSLINLWARIRYDVLQLFGGLI